MTDSASDAAPHALQQVVHALLREWGGEVAIAARGVFVDLHVTTLLPLGLEHRQRYRLFTTEVTVDDLERLKVEATALGLAPVAIAAAGLAPGTAAPADVCLLDRAALDRLVQESGVVFSDDTQRPRVDRAAFWALRDHTNKSFALVNGLLHLVSFSS